MKISLHQLKKIIFFLSINFLNTFVKAQQSTEFYFNHLNKGLSSSNVLCIHQDKFGFMWFGTKSGLNLYDGYNFTIYEYSPKDPKSIKNNWITSIAEDSKGNLLIGTYGGGLNVFDRNKKEFIAFLEDKHNLNSLPSSVVTCLKYINDEKILVGTSKGLSLFNSKTKNFSNFNFKELGVSSLYISAIATDSKGRIWLGTDNGVNLIDTDNSVTKVFNVSSKELNDTFVRSLLIDDKGTIWVGTHNGGINLLIPSGENYIHQTYPVVAAGQNNGTSSATILSLYQDNKQRIWIGTENGGLNLFDSQNKIFFHYLHNPINQYSISNNSIWSIAEDNTGKLWFGTFNKGLSIIDPYLFKFQKITRNISNPNGLNNSVINAFYEDSRGRLWVGTDGGGLNIKENDSENYTHYTANNQEGSLSSNAVLCIKEGGDSAVWIGTWGGGISICNNPQAEQLTFRKIFKQFEVFAIAPATSVSKGKTWVGTWGGGLFLTDDSEKSQIVFPVGRAEEKGLTNGNIFHILVDSKNRVWVGTLIGLNLLEQKDGNWKVTHFLNDLNDTNSLSSNSVLFSFEDSKGQIWIGTENGLNLYLEDSKNFYQLHKSEGLAGNSIKSMLEDSNGYLWIATNNGITKYNPQNKTTRNYDEGDGLQSNDFNSRAALISKKNFYFGGTNGYNVFQPETIIDNPNTPLVYITDFKLFNQAVGIGETDSPLTKDILLTNKITLTHKQSIFSFEFVALNFTHTQKNQYAYRMRGLEKNWNYVDNKRFASYSNLRAGTYYFEVKATNNDGLWSTTPAVLEIKVLPPWYETWYARVFFISVMIGSAVAFYKIRVSILKKQKAVLEEQVKERTKELLIANENLELKNREIQAQNEELHQLTEEISAQRDKLALQHQELENAYQDISKVSEIGKSVTANLSIDAIFEQLYADINVMFDAPYFSIGTFDEVHQNLSFVEITDKNQQITYNNYLLTDSTKPSVYCFHEGKPLIFNNFNEDIKKIMPHVSSNYEHHFNSALYYPLHSKGKKVGVIIIKSHQVNAFSHRQRTVFESLAAFVATAIDNTRAYQIIHDKNIQITDSIRYAETIQRVILPRMDELKKAFADVFLIFRPKDIVSGDFYWMQHFPEKNTVFVATVDCTGHGVPGAFMSMIGTRLLNEIIVENQIWDTSEVLEMLHKKIFVSLAQDEVVEGKYANSDGMDLSLCKIVYLPNHEVEVTYTGAKTSMYYKSANSSKLHKLLGDRRSIGGKQILSKRFTNQIFVLPVGSLLILHSDGIIDQNNPERKKFGTVRFETVLENNMFFSLDKLKLALELALDNYMEKVEQRDDITVLGIKL